MRYNTKNKNSNISIAMSTRVNGNGESLFMSCLVVILPVVDVDDNV